MQNTVSNYLSYLSYNVFAFTNEYKTNE